MGILRSLRTRALSIFACALGAVAVGAQAAGGAEPPAPDDKTIRVEGRLTDEGVECQVMRDAEERLYTLIGDLAGLRAGDEVIVQATRVELSVCMQGETLRVHAITKKGA